MLDPSKDRVSVEPMRNMFLFSLHFFGEEVVDRVVNVLGWPCDKKCAVFGG